MERRPEIDGLRALAVLPVILFHAGFRAFSGGYVGVDVFFVISGYLITSLILAEKTAGGFSLLGFYERRARRILPALFLVLLSCLPAAWLLMNPRDMMGFCSSLAAVPVFISNFFFWHQSRYFDTSADLKPLLHTWSLAVEEQYYLLFPIVVTVLWKVGKQRIAGLLAVCAVISLAAAEWGSLTYHIFTFYLLPTRGWEILAGALIALYPPAVETALSSQGKKLTNQLGSALGVLLILYAVWSFDKKTPYPSFYTLAPVLGTALIILFGRKGTLTHYLLSTRLLVGIGLISYSAYLWHQPLFAFARYGSLTEPDHTLIAALVAIVFLLGFLSWKYVEKPFRDRQRFQRGQIFLFAGLGSVIFIFAGLVGTRTGGLPQRFRLPAEVSESLTPSTLRDDCDKGYDGGPAVDFCSVGDRSKSPSIAVFGDSHSAAILPAFDVIGKTTGKGVTHIGLGACPPLLGMDVINGFYPSGTCKKLADREFESVRKNRIRSVFLVSRWTLYTDGEDDDGGMTYLGLKVSDLRTQDASRRLFKEALQRTLQAYQSIGADVYIFAQVPQQKIDPYVLYYKLQSDLFQMNREATLERLSVGRTEHEKLQAFTRGIFQEATSSHQAKTIVVDDVFCDSARCLIGRSKESFYFDADHLSRTGALKVVDRVRQQFRAD